MTLPSLNHQRLLLIEDDPLLGASLKEALVLAGAKVHWAPDGTGARLAYGAGAWDVVLADVGLPDTTGIQLCKEFQALHPGQPVLILTAQHDEETAVGSLMAGASDFVRKPFGLKELILRLSRLCPHRESRRGLGPLVLVSTDFSATLAEKSLTLTRREWDILWLLLSPPSGPKPRATLLQKLDPQALMSERTLDSHISHLRRKLSAGGVGLMAIYGVGYELVVEVPTPP